MFARLGNDRGCLLFGKFGHGVYLDFADHRMVSEPPATRLSKMLSLVRSTSISNPECLKDKAETRYRDGEETGVA
jgi:hypothetical protein